MLSHVLIDGFSPASEAQAGLRHLKKAANAVHGVILDCGVFRDQAVRLTVELIAGALPALRKALAAEGIVLFERSEAELAAAASVMPTTRARVVAMLHVTFLSPDDDAELAGAPRAHP